MANLITLISLNVVGLNNPIKRQQIAKPILVEQADIICIQETHRTVSKEHYLWEIYKGVL